MNIVTKQITIRCHNGLHVRPLARLRNKLSDGCWFEYLNKKFKFNQPFKIIKQCIPANAIVVVHGSVQDISIIQLVLSEYN